MHLATESRVAELRVFVDTGNPSGRFRLADSTRYGHGGGAADPRREVAHHLRTICRDMRNPYLADARLVSLRTQIEICA